MTRMSYLGWISLFLALTLVLDSGYVRYREWRARRRAIKYGRTLTEKFVLTPRDSS